MKETLEKLLYLLSSEGGKIVSAKDCTIEQLAEARNKNHLYVNDEGLSFVYLSI